MRICMYGASSDEVDKKYLDAAQELGRLMAERGHGLVYGGGARGLMGAAARGAHQAGGEIIGVAPHFFDAAGVLFQHCTQFVFTDTMRERKEKMEDLSQGFVAAPGGMGTWEEFFEILTLKQLERHQKPIVLLNTDGFYDPILEMFEKGIEGRFMKPGCRRLLCNAATPLEAVEYIENYQPEVLHMKDILRSE